ncbi:MAG TPA: hypothetical protein VGO93_17320 [Candidatus Xenobia bacterium]
MKLLGILCLCMLLVSSSVSAQSPYRIYQGTALAVRPAAEISSANAHEGDIVHFVVARPLVYQGVTLVAAGADAYGTVVKAEHSKALGRSGHLELTIDRVQAVDGSWIPVHCRTVDSGANQSAMAAGAVVFVSVFGALIQGHEAVIPTDHEVDVLVAYDSPVAPAGMISPAYGAPQPQAYTPPASTVVHALALCQSVGPDGTPVSAATMFPPVQALVLWASVLPPPYDQGFEVQLYQGNRLLNHSTLLVRTGGDRGWAPLYPPGGGFAPGWYRVDVLLNGQVQASQPFQIQ